MNPAADPIYAGISGPKLSVNYFDLGEGMTIRQTYAHLMAPFMMAFSPAQNQKPHPTPWASVKGGFSFDIYVELFMPLKFQPPKALDRLNTIWWITSLLRLRLGHSISVPVITNCEFAKVASDWKNADIVPIEVFPFSFKPRVETEISLEDLNWVKENWIRGTELLQQSQEFNTAYQAFDSVGFISSDSLRLIALWGALEQLFSPARQELRFRIATNIAVFLEKPGSSRLTLYRKVLKLYDNRSKAAHGVHSDASDACHETYVLMRLILLKIIQTDNVPSREQLEELAFSNA
jgi:hypothetical protein